VNLVGEVSWLEEKGGSDRMRESENGTKERARERAEIVEERVFGMDTRRVDSQRLRVKGLETNGSEVRQVGGGR